MSDDLEVIAVFKALRDRLERAGLFAGDAAVLLRELWGAYHAEKVAADRLAEMILFRECPECGLNLEDEADRLVASRASRR